MGQSTTLWHRYKYRFVPWLIFNWKSHKVRYIPRVDYFASEPHVLDELITLLNTLHRNETTLNIFNKEINRRNCDIMLENLGFCISRQPSKINQGGRGIFVTKGIIKKGHIAALYPGTIYIPPEPLFFQSFGNKFILQCNDGLFIDGNDRGLSKYIFKSCVHRDKYDHSLPADISWLNEKPINPLAVGQYVNNQSTDFPSNVVYQECNFPRRGLPQCAKLIPNITYSTTVDKIVALVATRDIKAGEELFSSYFTIIQS